MRIVLDSAKEISCGQGKLVQVEDNKENFALHPRVLDARSPSHEGFLVGEAGAQR